MVSARILLGLLVVLVAAQAGEARHLLQTCRYNHCPSGYTPVSGIANITMCPLCYKPAQIQCGSYVGKPLCCGGADGTICPSLACATSYSYSITGPGGAGCSYAQSTIAAFSFTNSTYNFKTLYVPVFQNYCKAPTTDAISAVVSQLVDAYADAVAKTLIQYNTYVCECVSPCYATTCGNNSVAYTTVSADVQAIARAQADSLLSALTEVDSDCFNTTLSAAYAEADAVASTVAAAVDGLHQSAAASNSTINCKAQVTYTQFATTIARAVACSYVKLFALARDSCTPSTAYACASSIALSGNFSSSFSCPANVECKPVYNNVVVPSCSTANTVLDPAGFTTTPVPAASPAPGTLVSTLTFRYPDDMEDSTLAFSSALMAVQAGQSSSGSMSTPSFCASSTSWCSRTPVVYWTQGQGTSTTLTITFPAGTTAFAAAVLLGENGVGQCTYSGLSVDGVVISDPSYLVKWDSTTAPGPKYVGLTVESWILQSMGITCSTDFAVGDIYISNVVQPSGVPVATTSSASGP